MKSPLLLPVYLVSVFLLFLLCFTAVSMTWAWVEWAPYGFRIAARAVLDRGIPLVESSIVAALLPAIFLTAVRVARHPVSRPFSLLLPLATVFCVLYFGPMGLRAIPSPRPSTPPRGMAAHLRPGVFSRASAADGTKVILSARMVVPEDGAAALVDLVSARPDATPPRLSWYPEGKATLEGSVIVVRAGEQALRITTRPLFQDLLEPSSPTLRLLADLGVVNRELGRAGSQTSAVLLASGLASFFWFSCFLLRLSRWPLLGFVMIGLLWRGALKAVGFVADVVRPAIVELAAGSAGGQAAAGETLPVTLLAAAALCLVLDLLFVRFDFWKREIAA